ncbi:MAG: tRNA pseudouridine(38-40) synthase TruA [Acidobacteria bacterium]|nr:tRNA pseudouridine(38-40) synthase TruA [Acidobacteriota bacterium]
MRTKLTIAYVGTAYSGWQRQANAPTVQAALEDAAAAVAGMPTRVHGAGRTDAGVHAQGQVAHFDADKARDAATWQRAINAGLDSDIRVIAAMPVSDDFHARHSARGKTYRYALEGGAIQSPFSARYAWHVGADLDIRALQAGAEQLLGPLDQRAFATQPEDGGRPDRPLDSVSVQPTPRGIDIVFVGRSFLRHAVRAMVGTLVEVGRGQRGAESVRGVAASGDRTLAGATAPAHGLCLEAVHYDDQA